MTFTEKEFEDYCKACYPKGIPDWQKQDLARCFYSGAFASYQETIRTVSKTEALAIFKNLRNLLQTLTNRN